MRSRSDRAATTTSKATTTVPAQTLPGNLNLHRASAAITTL